MDYIEDLYPGKKLVGLGKGKFAVVSCFLRNEDNQPVALKIPTHHTDNLQNEREILLLLHKQSNYICQIIIDDDFMRKNILVMNVYAGGALNKHIQLSSRTGMHISIAIGYAVQLVSALHALGRIKIIHRDIKTSNCVLDQHGHIKLCDFGSAKLLGQVKSNSNGSSSHPTTQSDFHKNLSHIKNRTFTITGTAHIMSPEMVAATVGYDASVDYWALGAVLYEILRGRIPPWNRNVSTQISEGKSRASECVDNREVSWPDKIAEGIARHALTHSYTHSGTGTDTSTDSHVSVQHDGNHHNHSTSEHFEKLFSGNINQVALESWDLRTIDELFVLKRCASSAGSSAGYGLTEGERREYGSMVDLVKSLLTVDPVLRLRALESAATGVVGGGGNINKKSNLTENTTGTENHPSAFCCWSTAVKSHPVFCGVDWDAVEEGKTPAPDACFDRRLGCLEFLPDGENSGCGTDKDIISDAEQALFEGF